MNSEEQPLQDSWDARYLEADRIWSGNVNSALAGVVVNLTPGTALDLGSGEGADVLWLAGRGWQATGVDISPIAVERAKAEAQTRNFTEQQARFLVGDLKSWEPQETFDLVTSSFLHSRGDFNRTEVLQRAQDFVSPEGYFLVISHATFPPWGRSQDHHEHDDAPRHDSTTPETELQLLGLEAPGWEIKIAETRPREATGPEGQQAVLEDTVVLAQRRS